MPDTLSIDPRTTTAKAIENRGVDTRSLQNRGQERDVTEQFLLQIGFHPAARGTTKLITTPLSVEDWVKQQEQRKGGSLKERVYKDLIFSVNAVRQAAVASMRKNSTLAPYATAADLILGAIATLVLTISGMIGGGVETLLSLLPSILQILFGAIKLVGNIVESSASGRRGARARREVNETIDMLSKLPDALNAHFYRWVAKFATATTEDQSIMIGELSTTIMTLLAPFAEAAEVAVQIPRIGLAVTEQGMLSFEKVGEIAIVVNPSRVVAAGALGSTALMAAGKSTGGGVSTPAKPKPQVRTPGKVLRKEQTLKDAGWGPRPPGAYNNPEGETYATKVTGSKESLYVGRRWTEFDGYLSAEELQLTGFSGYHASDQFLLDAKYASKGGRYDIYWKQGKRDFSLPPNRHLVQEITEEAWRQGKAWANSGAKGIVWIISDDEVAFGLAKLFKELDIHIKVIYRTP